MMMSSMRRILIGITAIALGFLAWYFTFMTFYESWIPYYYEEYLSYIFMAGSWFILVLPLCLAHFKFKGSSRLGYYRSFTWLGLLIFAIFALITVYMFSTGFWFGNGEWVYKIVPSDK